MSSQINIISCTDFPLSCSDFEPGKNPCFEALNLKLWQRENITSQELKSVTLQLNFSSCSFSLAFFLSTPIEKLLLRIKRGEIGCEFSGSHWLVVLTYFTASFLLFFWVSQCKQCWYFLMQFLFYYWIFH